MYFELLYYLIYFTIGVWVGVPLRHYLKLCFQKLTSQIWYWWFVSHKSIVSTFAECPLALTMCYHFCLYKILVTPIAVYWKTELLSKFSCIIFVTSSICLILLFIQVLFFSLHTLLASALFASYISRVALVLTCKYFFRASFFWDIINLHDSSHHSFLLEVVCVLITSLADFIIVSFICVRSPSVSCCTYFPISSLWRRVLYCFSIAGSCKLLWFHFICLFALICGLINFCFIIIYTRKWSQLQFKPHIVQTSSPTPFLFTSVITWSIWFSVLPSCDVHVPLCILLCW